MNLEDEIHIPGCVSDAHLYILLRPGLTAKPLHVVMATSVFVGVSASCAGRAGPCVWTGSVSPPRHKERFAHLKLSEWKSEWKNEGAITLRKNSIGVHSNSSSWSQASFSPLLVAFWSPPPSAFCPLFAVSLL